MSELGRLLNIDLLKIRKRMMTWILFVVLFIFMIIYMIFSYIAAKSSSSDITEVQRIALRIALQFPLAFTLVLAITQSIGSILMIILAASVIGNEYGWGSVSYHLTRNGKRAWYLNTKVLALIIVTLGVVFVGLATGFLLAIYTTDKLAGSINWSFFTWAFTGRLIRMFFWTVFTIMIYVLLAMFFAIWGRSAIAGIGGALGWYFIESILVGVFNNASGWSHRIPDYLISHNSQALLNTGLDRGPFGDASNIPSGLHATIVLLIYSAVLLILVLSIFRNQDLNT